MRANRAQRLLAAADRDATPIELGQCEHELEAVAA
jgi:hypothetical protein